MTENQKLREALQAIADWGSHDVMLGVDFGSNGVRDFYRRLALEALALPTAAPEMPLSMNQFGRLVELTREHLTDNTFVYKATSKTGDTCHFGVESAAKAWAKGGAVEAIKVREFKLHTSAPTADHLPDAGKMVETAEPVAERAAFEKWLGIKPCGAAHDFGWAAWQASSALSAGDAVDAQRYRWLADCNNYYEAIALISDGSLTADALGKAIDAAIAQGVE